MLKNTSQLPPRPLATERGRELTEPAEPLPKPASGASPAAEADRDRLEPMPRAIRVAPQHAPPPATGTAVAPATTPLPAASRYSASGVDVISYGSDPAALAEVGCAIAAVAQQPEIAAAMQRNEVTVVVIPPDRRMTDLPEFTGLRGQHTFDGRPWDEVRGVGGLRLADGRLAVGVPEENLTRSPSDRFRGNYSVALHELAHVVQDHCISEADYDLIERLYEARRRAGLPFTDDYAASNQFEYFAQATNAYFQRNEGQGINSRQWLADNDPGLYRKLAELYPRTEWPERSRLVAVGDPQPAPPSRGMLDLLRGNRTPDR